MLSLRDQIELTVRERRSSSARALVKTLLREERGSLHARLDASNYLRRLSEFSSALTVLDSPARVLDPRVNPALAARYDLQLSRMLNLLGASRYALRVLDGVDEETRQANIDVTLEILNSNYLYHRALHFAKKARRASLSQASYLERLRAVSIADTYFGAGQTQEAHAVLDEVLVCSRELLLQGIGHQAKAAYLMLKGEFRRAEPHLDLAESAFPEGDRTFDRGYLEKWIAAARIHRGEYAPARKALDSARRLLHRPGYKPEAWLEVVYWEGLLELQGSRRFPLPWARLLAYPAPTQHRLLGEMRKHTAIPEKLWLSPSKEGSDRSPWLIDFESRQERKKGAWTWGLNLPVEAAGWLALAGRGGIPIFRLCDALWPRESLSVRANLKRVEQILIRVRNELGLKLSWSDRHVRMDGSSPFCLWSSRKGVLGARFLRERKTFSRKDIESYYRLSPRAALEIVSGWIREDAVVTSGRVGRVQLYRARSE